MRLTSLRSKRIRNFARLSVQQLEGRIAPAVLFSDSLNRANVVNSPFALGTLDNASGTTPPHDHAHFYLPVWPDGVGGSIGADLVSNAMQQRGLDFSGIQFTTTSSNTSGETIGQDLNISADVFVPKTADGLATTAGIYFRSQTAVAGNGLIGGTSAGYWVRLNSSGEMHIRPLNASAGFEAYTARPASFNSTIFHNIEVSFTGTTLQVSLDGKLQTFNAALNGGLTTSVSIPATTGGTNNGTAGVSFSAEANRGEAGGARADNIIVSTYSSLTGLPVENNFPTSVDLGDAQDVGHGRHAGNYNTHLYDNGPSHIIVPGLSIGASVDGEFNVVGGSVTTTAGIADDTTGIDDEDGVAAVLTVQSLTAPSINVAVTNTTLSPATLYGWIDWDGDGKFELAERASVTVPAGTVGNVALNFGTIPINAVSTTFSRFRLSTDSAAQEGHGPALDGEVEDHPVTIKISTTSVSLSGGALLIDDINGANTNDGLTIKLNGANVRINDPSNVIVAGSGVTQIDFNTVETPLVTLIGLLTVTGQAGNDSLTLDLTGGDFINASGVKFDGGSGTGDRMTIAGGVQSAVTYTYTSATAGTVSMGLFGKVEYLGVDASIVNTGSATDVIFNLPAGPTNATLGDDTSAVNGLSRFSGATFQTTDFTNPANSVVINRGNANDSITVNALPELNRSLTIGGATTQFAAITFAGPVTLASTYHLNAFATSTINFSTSSSDVATSSSGSISLTTARNIVMASGSSLNSVNGDIVLKANQQLTPTAGNFKGIAISTASISSTSGAITLQGRGGNDASGSQHGVSILLSAAVGGGTSGLVTVSGTGGASSGAFNFGVEVAVSTAKITSGGGSISVTGQGGGTGGAGGNYGIHLSSSGEIMAGGAGIVTVTGTGGAGGSVTGVNISAGKITSAGGAVSVTGTTPGGGTTNTGIILISAGQISAGGLGTVTVLATGGGGPGPGNYGMQVTDNSTIDSAGGSVSITTVGGNTVSEGLVINNASTIASGGTALLTIRTDSLRVIDNASTIRAGATGNATVNIRRQTIATIIDFGGADVMAGFPLTLGITDAELDRVFAAKIDVGDSGTGTIKTSAPITRPANTEIRLESGVAMAFAADLDSAGGSINLVSWGVINQTAGTIQAGGGTLTVNAINQTATFNSIGNKAAQLAISSNSTTRVNGSFDTIGFAQVDGTLGGIGSVGTVTVMSMGRMAPGTSPGKLTTGNVVFNANSVFEVELNGNTAGLFDQLNVVGTVDLGNAKLQPTLGYAPSSNHQYMIIDNDGSDTITNIFNGYAEGAKVPISGIDFTLSYIGGDGNDVTLTAPVFPTVTSVDFGTVGHRSHVTQMVVNFSEAVTFAGDVTAAMTLARSNTSTQPGGLGNVILTSSPPTGPASSVTVTFSGPLTLNGSLIDGIYNFMIDADQVTNANGKLDGGSGTGSDYVVNGTTTNGYYRIFGDGNADGIVDLLDFAEFRDIFLSGSSSIYNYQGGPGIPDLIDFAEFRVRFNQGP